MKHNHVVVLLTSLLLASSLLVSQQALAANGDPLASAEILVQGTQLRIYEQGETRDWEQTVDVDEPSRVRTCYGTDDDECGMLAANDPRIAGLTVLAELRGPGLPATVAMETYPGGSFLLPGFSQQGDYYLENIRLVNKLSGEVLGEADPAFAVIHVCRIVLTSATVTRLSLQDLRDRGISLNEESFQAFNFAVGFAFGESFVTIDFPVIYEGNGTVTPLTTPSVVLTDLPEDVIARVEHWTPPMVTLFRLDTPEQELLETHEEENEVLSFPVLGAIVLPGTVTFLNQFFDAQLIVANGAQPGADVEIAELSAVLHLPSGNVLRLVATTPQVAPGTPVPLTMADGSRLVPPGERATATWTVEGLTAGNHVLDIDVTGQLERPGRDPFPVASRVKAAVEVVDARFHLTFAHPDVVRADERYSLFVTITNMSRVTQNLITLAFTTAHMTNAHPADPNDSMARTVEVLEPGQSETVEFQLIAELTGEVVATTFQASTPNAEGAIELYTGVGELGIPLSPATLILPRFANRLRPDLLPDDEYLRANISLLGLAYSLAVAPAGTAPNGLPRVVKGQVEQRAVDLAEAGQRDFLGDGTLETLEVLLLDGLGNRHHLDAYDELRRRTEKGLIISRELSELLQWQQVERNLDASELLDHLATTTSYCEPYLAAVIEPSSGAAAPQLVIHQSIDGSDTTLAGACTGDCLEAATQRSVPFAELYTVSAYPGSTETGQLAVIGHVDPATEYELRVSNPGNDTAEGRLVVLVPDGTSGDFRRVDLGLISLAAGATWAVVIGGEVPETGFLFFDPDSGQPIAGAASPSFSSVELPAFRIIGAVQDYRISAANRYGHGVSYLFNRPPDPKKANEAESWAISSTSTGWDTAGNDFSSTVSNLAAAAFVQPSGRVVNVRYTNPLSSLRDYSDPPLLTVSHQHVVDLMTTTLRDTRGEYLSEAPDLVIDPETHHVGGLVAGRVIRGDGSAATETTVQLIRKRTVDGALSSKLILDLVGETTTNESGEFYFDYIESPFWQGDVDDQFTLRAIVPAAGELAPAEVEEVSSVIRLQNRLARINIAMLGRGTVKGNLVYQGSGDPVADGTVTIASTLFSEVRSTEVDPEDGSFEIAGLPVGPLTLTGSDEAGRRVFATVGLDRPADTVEVLLQLPVSAPRGSGSVTAKVLVQPAGDPLPPAQPLAGADVAVYSDGNPIFTRKSNSYGNVSFSGVPAGRVTLQAAHWGVSRTAVLLDLDLAPGEEASVNLIIPEAAAHTVYGQVSFYDPTTGSEIPVQGATVFVNGLTVYDKTDADGRYRLEGVPTQAASETTGYRVTAIDYQRKLQGTVLLPKITDVSAAEIEAVEIVLREMRGGISGVVHNPLGIPQGSAQVIASFDGFPYVQTTTSFDGSFSFSDLPIGKWSVIAHVGDGLAQGSEGYFGETETAIVFGGHTPFAAVRMVGAGVVNVQVTPAFYPGVPVYYKPTYYSDMEKSIRLKGAYIEVNTDPIGDLVLVLPVGGYEIVAFNPFHGVKEARGSIDYAGQIKTVELVFEDASTVAGTVVDVDGVTPLPGIDVEMSSQFLGAQHQVTDAYGRFQYELVPKGSVQVRANGTVAGIERFGVASGTVTMGGQILELTVRMRPQITVEGQVLEKVGTESYGLATAQIRVREGSYPYRTFPTGGGWLPTDSEGRYSVPNVAGGRVTVIARDGAQVSRLGSKYGELYTDWDVLSMPDIFLSSEVGSLEILVLDPDSGAPLADCQVTLSNAEMTVSDDQGRAVFLALPLQSYSAYAFHAPTGRSGRRWVNLSVPGEHVVKSLTVDSRGKVRGTLFDDDAWTIPVANGTIKLQGQTVGGPLTALTSTSADPEEYGRFLFDGIPEGSFQLTGAINSSLRRAHGEVSLTETTPEVDVALVLEEERHIFVRLFEHLPGADREIHPDDGLEGEEDEEPDGLFSVNVYQGRGNEAWYDRTLLAPTKVYPDHTYEFPDVLFDRAFKIVARELAGEQRSVSLTSDQVVGGGTASDPYRVVLNAKGVVTVVVKDAGGSLVSGAHVTLLAGRSSFPSQTGENGTVTFTAVPAGALTATAKHPDLLVGGTATGSLVYDNDVVTLEITLAAAVSAHGTIYEAVANDAMTGDTELEPAAGVVVILTRSGGSPMTMLTGEAGTPSYGMYGFDGLIPGTYTVQAQTVNGEAWAKMTVPVYGANGEDIELPAMILDASPPRILSLTPANGAEEVSLTAMVEIIFSEALHSAVQSSPGSFFSIRDASGAAAPGAWTTFVDTATGRQVVRFTPSQPYGNETHYGIIIEGGSYGVRDQMGRPLSSVDIGSHFQTADRDGPKVLGSEPTLSKPVDPEAGIRFDFNEAVSASDGQLDEGELHIEWQGDSGWQTLEVEQYYYTRSGYSIAFTPYTNVTLQGDTLLRRVSITGLEDGDGNPMTEPGDDPWTASFRIRDANAPTVSNLVLVPAAGANGAIISGETYLLTPTLEDVDLFATDDPVWGDIDRVEYYAQSPDDPATQVQPIYSSNSGPFAYTFVGPNAVGDPRPLEIWVRAVDTSGNVSPTVRVSYTVQPNQPPTVSTVAVAPLAAAYYAGSRVQATVGGIDDGDDSVLTLRAELRQENGSLITVSSGVSVSRPATGWADLAPLSFELTIPIDLAEGTSLYVQAEAIDPQSARGYGQSASFAVAHDNGLPVITGLQVVAIDGGRTSGPFYIGERLRVELYASDAETDVASVVLSCDRADIFAAEIPVTRVQASGTLYRSAELVVPYDVFAEETAVSFTATATDTGDNQANEQLAITLSPEADPVPPTVTWLTPWQDGPWPADYSWIYDPAGTRLLLRLRADDTNIDPDSGDPIAGRIVVVEVRGPVKNQSGSIELAGQPVAAELVAGGDGSGIGEYQALWYVPNSIPDGTEIPFQVRVVDSGGNETLAEVRMTAQPYRQVYRGTDTAVHADDLATTGDPDGLVFLLDGAEISLYPRSDGSPLALAGLCLWAGGDDANGVIEVRKSLLTTPRPPSHTSIIKFYPLALELSGVLAVGAASRIDVSNAGLLGSTSGASMVLPGETAAAKYAGGSHGGRGWYGSPAWGWNHQNLYQPGSVYDSTRDPFLPGGGGGYGVSEGGRGGGVIRIDAAGATVRLAGDLLADGESCPSSSSCNGGGGAGGAILLVAGQLEGGGLISASGGHGSDPNRSGGGGGGRIAVYYETLAGFDLSTQVLARGGHNAATTGQTPTRLAGAGTIFLEALDAGGTYQGVLSLRNPGGYPAATTPLPALGDGELESVDAAAGTITLDTDHVPGNLRGDRLVLEDDAGGLIAVYPILSQERLAGATGTRVVLGVDATQSQLADIAALLAAGTPVHYHSRSWYVSVEASGMTRLMADDDLEVGPAAGPILLNDRSSLVLDATARGMLRGEGPELSITSNPLPGTQVRPGSTITVSWTASDPLGMAGMVATWDLANDPIVRVYLDAPTTKGGSEQLTVPATTEAGPAGVELTVSNIAGRTMAGQLSWTVSDNSPPEGEALFLGADTIVSGTATSVRVSADDEEGLAAITLVPVSEPAPVSIARTGGTVGGTHSDVTFTVTANHGVSETTEVWLQAVITDTAGATFSPAAIKLTIQPDTDAPDVTIELEPVTADDTYNAGTTITITVSFVDNVQVVTRSLLVGAEQLTLQPTAQSQTWTATWVAPGMIQQVADYVIHAEATDVAGNLGEQERSVTVQPVDSPFAPSVQFDCPSSGAYLPSAYAGLVLHLSAWEDDDQDKITRFELYRDDESEPFFSSEPNSATLELEVTVSEPLPVVSEEQLLHFTARAYDLIGNRSDTVLELRVVPTVDYQTGVDQSQDFVVMRSGTLTIDDPLVFAGLIVLDGVVVTHSEAEPGAETAVDITVNGPLSISCSGKIKTTSKGYGADETYLEEDSAGYQHGGSHLGYGNGNRYETLPGSTYGSVYRPAEPGAGSEGGYWEGRNGGGVVHLQATDMIIDGDILANGHSESCRRPGAGGSIRIISTGQLWGAGSITANGGTAGTGCSYVGGGGGGAVAVEYNLLSGDILERIEAMGGLLWEPGGAGTIYLRGPDAVYGDLIVSNQGNGSIGERTVLPALGAGAVELANGDIVLAAGTDSPPIQPYFAGHWVELSDDQGEVLGVWRLATINNRTVSFEPNDEGALPEITGGGSWRGLYLFDDCTLATNAKLVSDDQIICQGSFHMMGEVEAEQVSAGDLQIHVGAVLRHPQGGSLTIDLEDDLVLEPGAVINATGRGYLWGETYPDETAPGSKRGGNHVARGGGDPSVLAGTTFGSVYRPQEAGSGGHGATDDDGAEGGGVIRISATNVVVDGTIAANGRKSSCSRPGAGGSIWITARAEISGDGSIVADGGSATNCIGIGGGGGGAISLEYTSVSDTILDNISALGGDVDAYDGGAGTILLRHSGSTWGELIVDNGNRSGDWTAPPPLGYGKAVAGSGPLLDGTGRAMLVTDRDKDVPAYLLGHWVQISNGTNVRGVWPIVAIDGTTVVLGSSDVSDPQVAEDDDWRGLYHFDSVTTRRNARLLLSDLIEVGTWIDDGTGTVVMPNEQAPVVDVAMIRLYAYDGGFWIIGDPGALSDADTIGSAVAVGLSTGVETTLSVNPDGSFTAAPIAGTVDETVELTVSDAHMSPMSTIVEVGALPANLGPPQVDQGLIGIAGTAVVGQAGAVSDNDLPIAVVALNQSSLQTWSGTVAADGSFAVTVEGAGGDQIELTLSDGHPFPASTTVIAGTLAVNPAPVINRDLISFEYLPPSWGEGGLIPPMYKMTALPGAFTDDDTRLLVVIMFEGSQIDSLTLSGPPWYGVEFWLGDVPLVWGDEVVLEVTDNDADISATATEIFEMPPDNYGPPEVNPSYLYLSPMGLGYQLSAYPDWIMDGDWPLHVRVVNDTTGWSSPEITVESAEYSFSIAVQGVAGESVSIVARDSHGPDTWLESTTFIDTLYGSGVSTSDVNLDGHTVSAVVSDQLALLDGGTAVTRIFLDDLVATTGGLVAAVDLATSQALGDEPVVLDGGDLVAWWWVAAEPPTATAVRLSLSTGTLTSVEMLGDQLLVTAEESDGVHLYQVPRLAFDGSPGNLVPACGEVIESLLLSASAGSTALALIPAPDGQIGVILDDATAELRLVDPVSMTEVAAVDLDWPFTPTWVEGAGAEFMVGRSDGGVELWHWTEPGLDLLAEWQPDQGAVLAAERMGDQLWLGLDTGDLVQLSLADPSLPIVVGSLAIGYPVHDLSRVPLVSAGESSVQQLMAAATAADGTTGRLVRLEVYGIPSGIPAELVVWGLEGSGDTARTWVEVAPLEADMSQIIVGWQSDGFIQSCWPATQGCSRSRSGTESVPPLVWGTNSSGIPSTPIPASSIVLRSFDAIGGPNLVGEGELPGPQDPCTVSSGTFAEHWDGTWAAYLQAGGQVSYSSTGTSGSGGGGGEGGKQCPGCKASGPDLLAVQGQACSVIALGSSSLVVAADDLELWSLSSIADPYRSTVIEIFGSEPISAASIDTSGGNLLLGNDTVGLFSMLDPSFYPTVENQLLEGLEGSILGLDLLQLGGGDVLVVLSDAGTAGRLSLYQVGSAIPVKALPLSQLDLDAAYPAAGELVVQYLCNQWGACNQTIVVLRRGWGIEAYDSNLQLLQSLPLPGEPSKLRRWGDESDFQLAVACGSLGVVVVNDLLVNPTLLVIKSNAEPPGHAIDITPQGSVVTLDGIAWPPVAAPVPE